MDKIPWFKRKESKKPSVDTEKTSIPQGVWAKCPACRQFLYHKELASNYKVCPKCNYHFRISAIDRMKQLFDDEEFKELETNIVSTDPLGFVDHKAYTDRLKVYQEKKGKTDAVRNAIGKVGGITTLICAMDFGFMGGSMGSVVGEKICRAVERAIEIKSPLIVICASGGARMQEGALSLMQMGKVSLALAKMDKARLPFISILTDPTTGGTTASYAMLGDLNIAEPQALIGFAGPRVIQQTIRQDLPEGFQRSEFLMEHGMLDSIIERKDMKPQIELILKILYNPEAIEAAAS